jgi:hypothetical protein
MPRLWGRRSASGAWLARQTSAGCPDKRAPPGNRLARGALAESGPGTSLCRDGLSLVTGMVVPQRPSCPRLGYLLRSAG